MAEAQCVKVRIRPGTTEELVTFLRGLADRPGEVQESLAAEGIVAETLFIERTPDADYLVFYTRAEDLEAANRAFLESELPLDVETREMVARTWEEVTPLELVVDLERE